MRRIGLVLALGFALAPLATEGQQPTRVHRIGALAGTTSNRPYAEAFLEEMRARGYVEGQHLVMEHRGRKGTTSGSLPSRPSWSDLR